MAAVAAEAKAKAVEAAAAKVEAEAERSYPLKRGQRRARNLAVCWM